MPSAIDVSMFWPSFCHLGSFGIRSSPKFLELAANDRAFPYLEQCQATLNNGISVAATRARYNSTSEDAPHASPTGRAQAPMALPAEKATGGDPRECFEGSIAKVSGGVRLRGGTASGRNGLWRRVARQVGVVVAVCSSGCACARSARICSSGGAQAGSC